MGFEDLPTKSRQLTSIHYLPVRKLHSYRKMTGVDPSFAIFGKLKTDCCMLDLLVFPAGTEDTASTRLRALPILDELADKRVLSFSEVHSSVGLLQPILWIQKKITERHLLLAREFKRKGCHIIYDCDESGPSLSFWAEPRLVFEMFHLADDLIADTPERIQWIKRSFSLSRYSILENQIDYGMPRNALNNERHQQASSRLRILWYGNSCNLVALKEVVKLFEDSRDYQLVLCGATVDDANSILPGCDLEIHQWARSTFLDVLTSCDLCILSHSISQSDYRKSGHKMITSICHGVPVVASATPDYIRIARYAGVVDYLFSNSRELAGILNQLKDPGMRSKYISVAKPPLMEKYHPGSFVDNAIDLLCGIKNEQVRLPRIYQAILRRKYGSIGSRLIHLLGKAYWSRMQA